MQSRITLSRLLRAALFACQLLVAAGAGAATASWPADSFQALCYHEVRDDLLAEPDPYAVSTRQLAQQFEWLRENGYHVIAVDDILAARTGQRPLPPKAVLLTFDDGYKSFYTRVFPLLKTFHYPAVLGVVGSWIESHAGKTITGESHNYRSEDILTWNQLKELADSGLVEVASHSFDQHHGIVANPQRSEVPALVTHRYDPTHKRYENDEQYLARISQDLATNSDLLKQHLGKPPRVMVWPYGRYNQAALDTARAFGMPITLTLDDGLNSPEVPLDRVRRILISHSPDDGIRELDADLRPDNEPAPMRVLHVDLDYLYDPDPQQQQANLGKLLDRVRASGANTVFLQAYADPSGKGSATALYFPNRHLPVCADLFSYVAWQLKTRAGVRVYAWMPLTAFVLPPGTPHAPALVKATPQPGAHDYIRLSPFDPQARQLVTELYDDLARHALFDGLLFHDDATLTDFEDDSAPARLVYRSWGLPEQVQAIRHDPAAFKRWTARKTAYLTDFSLKLAEHVRAWQPRLKTARNLYASVALEPESEAWFAQSLPDFLAHYDYTAVMAMPYMEGAAEPLPWLRELAAKVAAQPDGLAKTVFELQAVDWRNGRPISGHTLAAQMDTLLNAGARSYGYYPDDFPSDRPRLSELIPSFSLQTFPYRSVQ
jgi:biofilm PGA synthesis lipoprotein PgaB